MIAKLHDNRYYLTVAGIVAIIIALFVMGGSDVTCGRKVMSPGDSCTTTKNGNETTRTYSEQRESDATSRKIVGIGGGIALTVGLLMIGLALAKRAGQAPPVGGVAHPAASAMPAPGYPQQAPPQQAHPQQAPPQQTYPQAVVPPVAPAPVQPQTVWPPVAPPPAADPFAWPDPPQNRPPQP
jgi:hypothetical protein